MASRKKWEFPGSPMPLFDRLVDMNPEVTEEPILLLNYNKQQLIESVIREASNLFNTRCTIPYKEYEDQQPSVLTYGVPELYGLFDSSYADPSRTEDVLKLCRFMANALRIFECRLRNIVVEMRQYDQSTQTAHFIVNADLQMGKIIEAISFPVEIDQIQELGKSNK
ncbi:MAG: hypothetical protein A2621_02310 [Alphaproteobacteria bacterium RIFCSPHIGHO2_01_FULL_41_14]|nr:MAG: hypothetical protein A3K20_00420 [Alphaproteobacteria bacterium GWA1_45_9]OFW89717.1 MAG: hypothetical protein A2621_02310 [Alphaproteobacteria bacterium RIFCSPHIGHO2_01_FULL_41_14]HCI49162.1 type VI secretion system baseplate subunit TssE [Holosporales bacterium]